MKFETAVSKWLDDRYAGRTHVIQSFQWLCDELEKRQPDVTVKKTERYVGFYDPAGLIFAYADFQVTGILIGVFEADLRRYPPTPIRTTSFPPWNNRSRDSKLVGIELVGMDTNVVDVLAKLYGFAGPE